jgi:hypothetical protein
VSSSTRTFATLWGGQGCAAALLCLAALVAPRAAAAQEDEPSPLLKGPEIHGFVSQGYIRTTENNYLAKSSGRGSFEMAEVGLNFTQQLTDKLRAGVQLFARDLGPIGNYDIKADWFYLDYRFADWFGLRAGRTKLPFGLYNEINDVDAARVPILLPQGVYPNIGRDFLLALTGLELYGRLATGALGALDYRLYGGTIFLEIPAASAPTVQEFGVPYLIGGRLLWETPIEGLRLGGSLQKMRIDAKAVQQATLVEVKAPVTLWLASIEYAFGDLQLAAEYGRWNSTRTSNTPALYPPLAAIRENGYVMAALRLTDWFEPGAYYSVLFPNAKDRKGPENQQHDVALTLRFDLNAHWLFKLEGHYMVGTADLSAALNDAVAPAELEDHWGSFLAKTTVYF